MYTFGSNQVTGKMRQKDRWLKLGNVRGAVETKCRGNLHYIEIILMRKPSDVDYGVSTGHPSQAVAKTFFFFFFHF